MSVAPSGLVWALTWLGSALVRLGVSLTDPSGTHWVEVAAPAPDTPLSVLGVGGAGVWAVARGGGVWLRQGVVTVAWLWSFTSFGPSNDSFFLKNGLGVLKTP